MPEVLRASPAFFLLEQRNNGTTEQRIKSTPPAGDLSGFNAAIRRLIRLDEAFSGTKFTGYIPDKSILKEKDAIAQFVTLYKTWDYSSFARGMRSIGYRNGWQTHANLKHQRRRVRQVVLVGIGRRHPAEIGESKVFLPEMLSYAVNDLIQGGLRAEAGQCVKFLDGRHAPHHVFKSGLVGLVIGNVLDGGGARGSLLHSMC